MSSDHDLTETRQQLAAVEQSLVTDPDNAGQQALRDSLKEYIALLEDVSVPLPPPDAAEGFGRADPSGRKGAVATEYAVNDKVLARWTDGKFYNAVVKSVYGPPHARQHMIRYTDYNEQRQVSAQDIKPLPKSATHKSEQEPTNKRKVESVLSPAVSNVPPVAAAPSPVTGTVSAAPKIDADLAKQIQADANRTTAEGEQRPKKSRKLETKAHLKKAQSSWRDFQASGKVKPKESMFRSSDSTSSRVGIIGSGQGMKADPKRSRHVHAKEG